MDHVRIDLLGCPVDAVDLHGAVARVTASVASGGPSWGVAVNAAKIVRMHDDPVVRDLTRRAHLVVADGASIIAAARYQGTPLPARVTGIDLMVALLAEAPRHGWRTFLLGARADVVEEAARRTRATAWHHGYDLDEASVVTRIRAARPHVLFVATGTPRQEHFLARHVEDLGVPFAMGVGGSLDVVAGRVRRAPGWVGDRGLEWAWRLAREPRARWRRAVLDSARFVSGMVRGRRLPDDGPTC